MKKWNKRYAVLAAGLSVIGAASVATAAIEPVADTAAVGVSAGETRPDSPAPDFPPIQRGMLSNGVDVMVAGRPGTSGVYVELLFDAGTAADLGRKPGTAAFTFKVLMRGMRRTGSREASDYGYSFCSMDTCTAGLHAADASSLPLVRFAGVVRSQGFPAEDIQQVRSRQLAFDLQHKTDPAGTAWRLIYPRLYGSDHAYASDSGRGNQASLASIGVEDLAAFRDAYIRPHNLRIVVTGDTTLAEVLPQLDVAFGDWTSDATVVTKPDLRPVAAPATSRIVLVNSPGADRSFVMGGVLAPPGRSTDLWIANEAFAESRLWRHGVTSHVQVSRGQSPLLVQGTVDADKTAAAVSAIHHEAMAVIGARPLSDDEIARARQRHVELLATAPGDARTDLDFLRHVAELGLPDDYWQTFRFDAAMVNRTSAEAALSGVLKPDAMTWVVVGDLGRIEAPIRALNLGEVSVVDYDGVAVGK